MLVCWYISILYTYIFMYLCTEFWITWLAYPSSHDLTGFIVLTSSYSSCRSCLTNWYISIIVAVILFPPSLALSLKILSIFRLSIRGIVSFYLICCHPSLMPPSIASIYHATLVALILSINKVMPSCSYYIKKGLVYITIIALSSYQPLSYTKYIKLNICLSYNIYSISNIKYIYYSTLLNYLVLYLSYYRVLDLICC